MAVWCRRWQAAVYSLGHNSRKQTMAAAVIREYFVIKECNFGLKAKMQNNQRIKRADTDCTGEDNNMARLHGEEKANNYEKK